MKWRRKLLLAACAALAVAARGELADYIQRLEIADRLQGVSLHSATLPAGPVLVRRPPAETRQVLGLMISASAGDAQLYALRAQEAELALDFAAAEADWKKHAELARDQAAARMTLAGSTTAACGRGMKSRRCARPRPSSAASRWPPRTPCRPASPRRSIARGWRSLQAIRKSTAASSNT